MNLDSIKRSFAGFSCSAIGIAVTFPAESLVRQFHVTDRTVTSRSLISKMKERGIRGFYRGLGPALITQPAFWAVYMPTHEAIKRVMPHQSGGGGGFATSMGIAWAAAAVSAIGTNPVWVIRQRMQTEIVKGKKNTYQSLVKEMWAEAGAKTFFRGTALTLVKNVQLALLMPLFEHWKEKAERGEGIWCQLGLSYSAAVGLSAASAKIVSSTGVYPLDVIRTNHRFLEGKNVTLPYVARQLMQRTGGVKNLFRGVGWYWLSSAGTFTIMMSLQPHVKKWLKINQKN